MPSPLLDIPVEVREHIYAKLLDHTPSATSAGKAPSSPLCKLLFLSRQLHNEVKDFLGSQLCVLIKTNDPEFVQNMLKDNKPYPFPIVSQLWSKDSTVQQSTSNAPIAMELDLYMYHNHLPAESSPAFMITAASTKALLNILWLPDWSIWTMQASASFDLLDNFSHSLDNATRLLVQPWIDWFVPSHFLGVSTSSEIPEALASQLNERILGDYSAGGLMANLNSLLYVAKEKSQVGDWGAAAERFRMAAKYAEVLWSCHLECLREVEVDIPQKDFVLNLWIVTNETLGNYAQTEFNAATAASGQGGSESSVLRAAGSQQKLERARQIAERGIFLLSMQLYIPKEMEQHEQLKKFIRKNKAKVNFRLHLVCKSTGDFGAAVEYLEEALKHEPESERMLREKIDALKLEAPVSAEGALHPIVRWGSVDFW